MEYVWSLDHLATVAVALSKGKAFQVSMYRSLQHLCAAYAAPSLENASDSCTSFKLTSASTQGSSPDLLASLLTWRWLLSPELIPMFLLYLNSSHLPNPSNSHTIAWSPGTVAEMCHTLVCSIAQDRNGQFAFNWEEEHRTNAKVSVWTQRWQNRCSRTLSLEKPYSMDLNSWNTR